MHYSWLFSRPLNARAFGQTRYHNHVREKVLRYIREGALLRAGDRVAVAVSGGADSLALLRVLVELRSELGIVLSVAHFNHGLRDAAAADEAFVAALANDHGLEFFAGHGDVRDHAFTSKLGIEAAGRELRYRWFGSLAQAQRLDAIATAHTLDDQAETVLLKFLRGAGTKGLAGIYPVVRLETSGAKAPVLDGSGDGTPEGAPLQNPALPDAGALQNQASPDSVAFQGASLPTSAGAPFQNSAIWPLSSAEADSTSQRKPLDAGLKASSETARPEVSTASRIIRPLLCVSRQEVEAYLSSLGQPWREDETNLDRRFLRNRVRHELLPLLEKAFNPNVRESLSDLAEIARDEEEYWRGAVDSEIKARLRGDGLQLGGFLRLPIALQRRLLMRFATQQGATLDFQHVERLRSLAAGENFGAELPGGLRAERKNQSLSLCFPVARADVGYRHALSVPGEVQVAELNLTFRAYVVETEFADELPSGEALSLDLLQPELIVRNWLPGDRFWPAHSSSEEKLKRLFAEKHVPAQARPAWPVILSGDEIVWVKDLPVNHAYRWKGSGRAVRIDVTRS